MSVQPEQFMSPEQLTVSAFFWGSAVVIALDAIKQSGARAKTLGTISIVFVVAGFLVKPLWNIFPDVSQFLLGIAAFPPTWFFLAGGAYFALRAKLPDATVGQNDGTPHTIDQALFRAEMDGFAKAVLENSARQDDLEKAAQDASAASTKLIQDHQIQLGHALDYRVAEMEKTLNAAAGGAGKASGDAEASAAITKRLKREYLDHAQQQVMGLAQRHETDFQPFVGMMDSVRKGIYSLMTDLVRRGYPEDRVKSEFENITQNIKSDAVYAFLDDDEKTKFAGAPSGTPVELKRQWHTRKQQLEFLSKIISEEKDKLGRPDADIANLRIFTDG